MKQPDRESSKRVQKKKGAVDPVLKKFFKKAIWVNFTIAMTILVLFRFLLPMFFTGGGSLSDGGTLAMINSNLSSALESGSLYAAGLFMTFSFVSWLVSAWLDWQGRSHK